MPKALHRLRTELRWSQSRMADELGISQPSVWRIERGLQEPSKSVAKLIGLLDEKVQSAKALGLGDGQAPASDEASAA